MIDHVNIDSPNHPTVDKYTRHGAFGVHSLESSCPCKEDLDIQRAVPDGAMHITMRTFQGV